MIYLSHTVYDTLPFIAPEPGRGLRNDFVLVGRELQKQTKTSHELTEVELNFTYTQETLAQRATLRTFFDTMKGRNDHFWVPSWKRDFVLTRTLTAGSGQINAQTAYRVTSLRGYTRHIYVNDPSTPWAAKITAIAFANGEDIITFTPAASTQVTVGSTIQIMNLYFCRFDMDALRIEMVPDSAWSSAVLQFKELQKETP